MTDRELLEAAAKAAGIGGSWQKFGYSQEGWIDASGNAWNPLHDDGDSMRLGVRLSMTIVIDCEDKTALAVWYTGKLAKERFTDQASALVATRRAIVRCAAEAEKVIGRAALGETKREG